jgi:hypothetical protein
MHSDTEDEIFLQPHFSKSVSPPFPPLVPPWFLECLRVLHEAIILLLCPLVLALLPLDQRQVLSLKSSTDSVHSCVLSSSSRPLTTSHGKPPQLQADPLFLISSRFISCPLLMPTTKAIVKYTASLCLTHLMILAFYFLLLQLCFHQDFFLSMLITLNMSPPLALTYSLIAIARLILLIESPCEDCPSLRFSVELQIIYFTSRPATTYASSYRREPPTIPFDHLKYEACDDASVMPLTHLYVCNIPTLIEFNALQYLNALVSLCITYSFYISYLNTLRSTSNILHVTFYVHTQLIRQSVLLLSC